VARLLTSSLELINMYNQFHPEKAVNFWYPRFTDVKTNGIGYYLHDPATADPARVFEN
jgi:hypothetical protein